MSATTKKSTKARKGTIDDLAVMVANGFTEVQKTMDERFATVDDRFDALETRMVKLEDEVHATNTRLDTIIRPELDSHAQRIKNLELKVG